MPKIRLKEYFEKNDSWQTIIFVYVVLGIAAFICLYPVLNVLTISLRPNNAVFSTSLKIIPDGATFQSYIDAFTKYDLLEWMRNSLIVSGFSSLLGMVLSVAAGYAFSRFEFFGKKQGLIMLLVTQMFPIPMLLLPLYIMLVKLGLSNSFFGLIMVYVATAIPFNIWIMKGYFDTIPKTLEESAAIDGAPLIKAFYLVILPLAKPGIAIATLFSFMGAWSEYLVARVLINDSSKITLPVGLVNMLGQFATDWGIYSAMAMVTALPVMIVFIVLSKYLVGGLTVGSVKG
jgi:arabinogalactan oligomer/maltooligosaccharide transport system permease protein